ncbi:hypothetical protein BN946_scf185043.g30 [Trametes cinnabarina]|uniref:Uncharacterized protein n=1 Tax=Pycnoporus cinnabarinus TaxID=5643 RepID=A0A060SIG7_PYCCI|nr:hypothetical protein BN946_scf185043.g30 [Trametes cinnabarina]
MHVFRAVPASYQTAQGLVSGIQWIPVEATSVVPANAVPAAGSYSVPWPPSGRPIVRDDDYRRKDDLSRNSVYDRDRRDRYEDDDYYRRDRDDDPRRARDRDARDPSRRLSSYGGRVPGDYEADKYDKYDATADIERRLRDVELDRRDKDRDRDRDYERERTVRSRRNSVYGSGDRPTSTYQAAVGGNYPTTYSGTAYSSGSTYAAAPGGAYPSSPRPGDVVPPRAVSPYRTGGALPRPSSPYQAPIAPRPVSPYQVGAVPRAASPFQVGAMQRAASPYGGGGIQRAASPYGGGGIQRAPSPYAAAMQRSASPYAGTNPLPNSSVYPPGHVLEGQPIRSHSRISAYPSPRIGSGAMDPAQQGMLTVPEGFNRPPNRAQPYTHFDIMKIQDMDELLEAIPRMPAVLVPHDVYHEDWIRLMQDLAMAWAGTLPVPQYDGRPPKRSTLAADVIDLWNASFFKPRGVEMVLYKGRERRSGRLAGTVDMNLPGFDEYDVSSPSDSSDDDDGSAEERHRDRDRYGAYGGVYGRQAEAELREARRARRERKAERKKRKMEKKIRKRAKELERTYAIYLQCVSPLEGM